MITKSYKVSKVNQKKIIADVEMNVTVPYLGVFQNSNWEQLEDLENEVIISVTADRLLHEQATSDFNLSLAE